MADLPKIVYCHCKYAAVVPENIKKDVLLYLTQSEKQFLAVPDLCEMASCSDPMMKSLASQDQLTIVACYPRAVKALFESAGAVLTIENTTILNMRTETSETIINELSEKK